MDSRVFGATSSWLIPPAVTTHLSYPTYPSISIFQFFSVFGRLLWSTFGFVLMNPAMSCIGITLVSRTLKRSLYGLLALRLSFDTSFHKVLILTVRSSMSTAGFRSMDAHTLDPFMIELTHFLLTLNPIGPSIPPSVKSISPNSSSAVFPSMIRFSPTFFSWFPQSISPISDRGVLRSIWPLAAPMLPSVALYPLGTIAVSEGKRVLMLCPIDSAQ